MQFVKGPGIINSEIQAMHVQILQNIKINDDQCNECNWD